MRSGLLVVPLRTSEADIVARVAVKEAAGRAQRFGFDLPLRYREAGGAWHDGRIENISRSGVLFHGDDLPDVDAEIEIVFALPVHPTPPRIVCRGRVVRTIASDRGDGARRAAATIARYRFVRCRTAPP